MWTSLITEAMGAAEGESDWRDCHNVIHVGIYVGLNGHQTYNIAHPISQAWSKNTKFMTGQVDVYEHSPRCGWGACFMFGIAVAVLGCAQICCFLNGNDIANADWNDDSDEEYSDDDEAAITAADDDEAVSTAADEAQVESTELSDVASGKVLV
jgi:hypothetical protein